MPSGKARIWAWAAAAAAAALLMAIWLGLNTGGSTEMLQQKVKSGNLSVDYSVQQALSDAEQLSLNTVNVPVMVLVDSLRSSTMKLDQASLDKARTMIRELKKRNIRIILEPYPWIASGELYETEWNPDDIPAFFTHWKTAVLNELIRQVAVPEQVDVLCIASNLSYLEAYDDQWLSVAEQARAQFDGLITYKTNWWYTAVWDESSKQAFQAKLERPIFGKVDFISVGAYFELSDQPENTVDQLVEALYGTTVFDREQNVAGELEQLHNRWNKPIFMGELGFPKRNYAAMYPWNPSPSDVDNGKEQARGFEAYRRVFTQDWFLGFSVFAIGENGEDKHYYPSRESVHVIKEWFK
ncbi:glycoside hydrolase family 113 [Paenibacillus sp. y28]|uniref:glycoside hydrolase family 113 n=1 Tax=Paenibacillus sp. y28 TaxID=3129110 RepID=UPI00301B27D1